ncbi:MAG: hypothetical protein JW913_19955 [Chitinispirillaceae bacterium]|nr:hypothetical protein [Chitinispirillaceae bacterium]
MKKVSGLWIDHRKAIIVTISDKGETTQQVLSNVEKQLGRFKGKHSTSSFESGLVQADDRQQSGFTKHLKVFYDEVLSLIGAAQSVLIFGPGEGKGELKKLMAQNNRLDRVAVMETADKMTDRQIAARVRHYFSSSKVEK